MKIYNLGHYKYLIKNGIYILICSFLIILSQNSFSITDETCTWYNPYSEKTEIVNPKIITDSNGDLTQDCQAGIAERRFNVERARAKQHVQEGLGDTTTIITEKGSSHCAPYIPPKTHRNPNPTPIPISRRQIGTKSDGSPRYESCQTAKYRYQKQYIEKHYDGHREDAEEDINAYNRNLDEEAESASKKADRVSKNQQIGGLAAGAGAIWAGTKAYSCCSATPACGACPYLVALTAGLGFASIKLISASGKNKGISRDYASLVDDPSLGSNGNGDGTTSSDDGWQSTTGGVTTGATGGVTTGATTGIIDTPLPPPFMNDPPVVTLPDGTKVVPTTEAIENKLKENGWTWDPDTGKITLPDGRSFSGSDTGKYNDLVNAKDNARMNAQLAGLADQLKNQYGGSSSEGLGADGSSLGEDDSLLGGSSGGNDEGGKDGGGGFAGYGTGSKFDGAGGSMTAPYALGQGKKGLVGGKKDPATEKKLAGMSVKLGKDRVGVRQANIFTIMHRRYTIKRKKNHFIKIKLK